MIGRRSAPLGRVTKSGNGDQKLASQRTCSQSGLPCKQVSPRLLEDLSASRNAGRCDDTCILQEGWFNTLHNGPVLDVAEKKKKKRTQAKPPASSIEPALLCRLAHSTGHDIWRRGQPV